jgi:hypothetical protein
MKIPFSGMAEAPKVDVVFMFSGTSAGDGSIALTSEGGGAYVEIKSEEGLRLNADEIIMLGSWAVSACAEIDVYNQEGEIE